MRGSATYFGSKGLYYSYGNKGNYDMVGNSSMGQYINKPYKDKMKSSTSDCNDIVMEEIVLEVGIDGMSKTVPNI